MTDPFKDITEEQAAGILKKISGPLRRELEGEDYDQMWLILQFLEPTKVSNNQRSITEVYHQNNKVYYVHYFTMNEKPMIEEIEDFDS